MSYKSLAQKVFSIFSKTEKSSILYSFIPFLYMSYKSLAQKVLPRQNSVRFCFLPKKGSLIFKIQKNGCPDKFYCPKDSKKVNIFEIGSLEVYYRGGVAQGLHCIASLHVYIYMYVHKQLIRNIPTPLG